MLRNKVFFTFIIILTLSRGAAAESQEQAKVNEPVRHHSRDIITIIEGRQYAAFEDYKMEKLRNSIKKKMAADAVRAKEMTPSQWIRTLSPHLLIGLDESQIRDLIQEVALFQMSYAKVTDKSSEIQQMRAMLNEFYSDKENPPAVSLDENKIKTIYISPK